MSVDRKYGFELACTARHHPMTTELHRHQAPHGLNGWHSVVYNYIGGFNLLISGDIPCVKAPYTAEPANFVELKCRKLGSNIEKDLKDWYFRAHVMGSSGVFVGYRDEEHVLRQAEFIPTSEILGRLEPSWNPEDSINRLFQVLYVLRLHCQQVMDQRELRNDHGRQAVTWNIKFQRGKLCIRELSENEAGKLNATEALPQTLRQRVGVVPRLLVENMRKYVKTKALEP
ncbi:hypothetical protein PQX77_004777 [Marasmius sp. AFHP31]|nr:hypothetical protein PQX77_004777 [Marasmius sp. AFHP31]